MKHKFVDVINQSLDSIAIPHQNGLNLHPCLGKPNGECRTICKAPMLYRMIMKTDQEIREWELNTMDDYDSASVGGSALHAALQRNLKAEIAHWLDEHSAAVFNDFEKFLTHLTLRF